MNIDHSFSVSFHIVMSLFYDLTDKSFFPKTQRNVLWDFDQNVSNRKIKQARQSQQPAHLTMYHGHLLSND